MPERRTHDYVPHGTTTLFAAMNVADGTVITSLHRRHRAIEFEKFLAKILRWTKTAEQISTVSADLYSGSRIQVTRADFLENAGSGRIVDPCRVVQC